jgi:hypothetical protein
MVPAEPEASSEAALEAFERRALEQEAHEEVRLPEMSAEELREAGYRRGLGTPKGQEADYRRATEDGRGFHIRDYGESMTIHWDHTAPSEDPIGHLADDAEGSKIWGGLLAAMGFGSSREGD